MDVSLALENVRVWRVIGKAFSAVKDDGDPPGQRSWGRGSQYPAKFPDTQEVAALQAIGGEGRPQSTPGYQELGLPWETICPVPLGLRMLPQPLCFWLPSACLTATS